MIARPARLSSDPLGRLRAKRRSLLVGAALGAALLLAPRPALAQATPIDANPTTVNGNVTYSRDTVVDPTSETMTINTPTAIIHWAPKPPLADPFVFLRPGTTATFQNGPGIADFAVLNRILVTVPARFDGNLISRISDSAGVRPGGTILFSSPGGIIVGSTAMFDVGNLVLTSLNVVESSPGTFTTPAGGFRLAGSIVGPAQPNAAVVTEPGAVINASSPNSYVALVAPRVIHGGSTRVNGSTAYIAADAVDFTVNQGLFDITITAGSDNANPIVHTGNTGGPAASGAAGDNHAIYLASVARNQAITLLLQGSAGYDPAVAAGVENGVIVLSAGHNVVGGSIDPAPVPASLASLSISGGPFTSDVIGRATGAIIATAPAGGTLAYANALQLDAAGALSFVAGAGGDVTVGENATLNGGTVDIDSLTVTGSIDVNSGGALTVDQASGGTTISLQATGAADLGTVDATSNLIVGAASIALDDGTAGEDMTLNATGDIDVAAAQAGDDFRATAGGTFGGGNVVVTGLGSDIEDVGTPLEGHNILVDANGDLQLDDISAPGRLELNSTTGSILSNGLLDAGADIELNSAADIDVAALDAGGAITTNAPGDTTIDSAVSGGSISIFSNGVVVIGTLNAVDNVLVDPISISIVSVVAGGDIDLTASQDITVGFADAGDDFTANAGTTFDGTTVIARGTKDSELGSGSALEGGNIFVNAINDLRLDNGDAATDIQLITQAGSILGSTQLTAGRDIRASAGQNIDIADADAGASITLNAGSGFIDAASLTTTTGPISTNSGTATTIAAADSGGTTQIVAGGAASLGTLRAGGDLTVDALGITLASGTAANDIGLDSGANILVTTAQAGDDFGASAVGAFTGGTVTTTGLGVDDEGGSGLFGGSAIVVAAGNDLRLDNGTAPTRIQLDSITGSILSGGTLRSGVLQANAPRDLLLNDIFVVSALNLATTNGRIAGRHFESDGNIDLNASGTVTLAEGDSDGTITVVAGGLADLGSFVAVGDIGVTAPNIDFDSATAGRDVTLAATANIVLGAAQAGDDVVANAGATFTGGTVTITGAGADSEAGAGPLGGRNIVVDATGNLRLDNGTTPGVIDLASTGGSVLSGGTLTANRLAATTARDFTLNNVSVVAPLALVTTNGSISGNSFTSGGDISLDASGTVTLAAASSGRDILITGGGNIDVGSATAPRNFNVTGGANGEFTNVTAASIIVALGTTARFDGNVAAPTITVTSSDIDIPSGSLGNAATQTVALIVRPSARQPAGQTVLGGATQAPGYTLTDAEADRISAVTLSIQAPAIGAAANRPPDVLIRDLSLTGQRIGTLQIVTPGILQVEGGLLLSNVRPGGFVDIRATERLQILNPTGSVGVRDGAGLTDGTLLLVSNNIWSANQALLDQLRADSNFAGRDEALLANPGAVQPRGYIEAGDVVLSARDSLFVQNSGTLAAFAGITVRQTTLRIVPTGATPLRVFAFGRRINPDGSFVTNNAFFNEVQYQGRGGPVGYTDDAQFNLCFINTGICRLPTPNDPLPGGPDIIEEPVGGGLTPTLPAASDDLVDTSFADEPLIEEPVTSGGDSILWDCDNDDDGDCDEDDYDG